MQRETWKPISGFEGIYEVSSLGRVRRVPAIVAFGIARRKVGGMLKCRVLPKGYQQVMLRKNNKRYFYYVHCLVAEAFVPNPRNKPEVNHLDGIRANNRASNLEWVTRTENHAHKINILRHGFGSQVPSAKLDEDKVREIRSLLSNGEKQQVIADSFGVHRSQIQSIKARRTWKQVA